MIETTTIRLWFVRETDKARLYTKVPPQRNPRPEDNIWVPLSVIEHTTKRGDEHTIKLPEWFVLKNDL